MRNSAASEATLADVHSEEELLEREDRLARRTLRSAARGLGNDVERAFDLERIVGGHPFRTLLVSVAGGVLLSKPLARLLRRPGTMAAIVKPLTSLSIHLASVNVLKEIVRSMVSDDHRAH